LIAKHGRRQPALLKADRPVSSATINAAYKRLHFKHAGPFAGGGPWVAVRPSPCSSIAGDKWID